jgi:vesicle coat complex subunit
MSNKEGGDEFFNNKKGEIAEWKELLSNEKEQVRKETVKKVIAAMTVGKDVSSLFPNVLNNIASNNIELKKLVYLYVMNYAKTQPELVLMSVNTFIKVKLMIKQFFRTQKIVIL